MNELKELINRGEDPELSKYSLASVAGVLKQFFRSLPEPLMTYDSFDALVKTNGKGIPLNR